MGDNTEGVNAVFYISLCTILFSCLTLSIKYCYKSKCSQIDFCCIRITRNIEIEKEEDLNNINILDSPNNKYSITIKY